MKLIILGIQGSGKGTQGKLIAETFKLTHISIGDLLRKEISEKSELGEKVSSYTAKGVLVPDSLINEIFIKNLPKDNYILDGYPRNKTQVEFLEKTSKVDKVIFLELPDEEVFHRLDVRLQCNKCKIYYGLNNMPKQAGVCDKCGEKMEHRKDDNVDGIKQRISLFKAETLPILNFYKERVVKINGNQSVEAVFLDIRKVLEKL
jgi:adenylate kinase